jgi:hypothetical protein
MLLLNKALTAIYNFDAGIFLQKFCNFWNLKVNKVSERCAPKADELSIQWVRTNAGGSERSSLRTKNHKRGNDVFI